jgi:hypothetical protein
MATDEIEIEVADQEGTLLEIIIRGPFGAVRLIGDVYLDGRRLRVEGAHIDGPGPGTLGRSGLNAIGRKILEDADVEQVIIEGSTRTTGRNPGRPPKPLKCPRV